MSNEIRLRSYFAARVAGGMEKTFLKSVEWAMNDGSKLADAEDLAARNVARLSWLVADALLKQAQNPKELEATPVYWE